MAEPQRSIGLSHLAVGVVPGRLTDGFRSELVRFYGSHFGWAELEEFARPDRMTIAIGGGDYLNLREVEGAVGIDPYGHLGLRLASAEAVELAWEALAADPGNPEVEELQRGPGGFRRFRLRHLLPVAVEVQFHPTGPHGPARRRRRRPMPTRWHMMRVEPLRLEWIEALVEGDAAFTERFGIPVLEGWSGFPEALPHALDAARRQDADPWGSHLFFGDDGALVGFGGFKGAPVDGEVEIGYAIAPASQGRGLATAAARAMIDRAAAAGCGRVVAHTLATPNASTAVLARCGFTRTATIADPDGGVDDDVWRWELTLG